MSGGLSALRAKALSDGLRRALRDLLPALDDLETCYRQAEDREALAQGVRAALRSMWDVFRQHELERIEGDCVPFDPRIHEAAEVTPSDSCPAGTVLEVLRVGYLLGGELVRPALVRVSVELRAGDPVEPELEESLQ